MDARTKTFLGLALLLGVWAVAVPSLVSFFKPQDANAQFTSRYEITNSLHFDSGASDYLSFSPGLFGTSTTWTFTTWVKRGKLGSTEDLFSAASGGTYFARIYFNSSDQLVFDTNANDCSSGSAITAANKVTNAVFRDPSAWYHIMVAVDTTQSTASNRERFYVNGVEVTSWATNTDITQNAKTCIDRAKDPATTAISMQLGRDASGATNYYDGLLAQTIFVDGKQLTPSSFGYSDQNGYWRPQEFQGTTGGTNGIFGTNGFWFTYASTTALGWNYATTTAYKWTVNVFGPQDQLIDSPSHSYAACNSVAVNSTCFGGNLKMTGSATSTILMTTGKWYWEVTALATGVSAGVVSTGNSAVTTSVSNNTTMGFEYDADAGTLASTTDGSTFIGTVSGLTGGRFAYSTGGSAKFIFGQGGTTTLTFSQAAGGYFRFTPPSGYKAVATFNLPTPSILQPNLYFDAITYTGTGLSLSPSTANFQPDIAWLKDRTNANDNALFDSIRGVTNVLITNKANAQLASSTSLTSFNSNGFTLGTDGTVNKNTDSFISWIWKRSPTTDGVDIVTYTGNGANGRSISHSLGVAPNFMIVKSTSQATNWFVYSRAVGAANQDSLNATTAFGGGGQWTSTDPTASVFTVGGTGNNVNESGQTYVAYLFAPVSGFSQFGTYTGNGSTDGPFIYTGFKPRWILVKRTDSASTLGWRIYDSNRDNPYTTTGQGKELLAESNSAEGTVGEIQFEKANGFKLTDTNADTNAAGGTYMYAAFAQEPFALSATNIFNYFSNLFTPSGQTIFTVPVQVNGALSIQYQLSKGSGTFAIDDPLDPKNKILFHSFVESPDQMNVYDGIATLDQSGEATITLPDYFMALNQDYRYLTTPIGASMPNLYIKQEVRPQWFGIIGVSVFTISGGVPGGKVSWQVTGIRHDPYALAHPIVPEVPKGPGQLVDQGYLLYPGLYNPDGTPAANPPQ